MTMDKPSDQDLDVLARGASALGIALNQRQLDQFARFRALLLEWNERVNLTAITDPAAVVSRHFLDSLTCALAVPEGRRNALLALIDIGSGAGFPGLALAIAFPHWRVVSLDATRKKTRFQEAVVEALKLRNARVIVGRAEEMG